MTNPFYDPKKLIVSRTGEQAYKDYLDRMKSESKQGKKQTKQQKIPQTTSTGFSLEDLTNFWQVDGVNYRNGVYQVDLAKTLLDEKATKTQDEWAQYSKEAISKGEFYVGDFPLYHSLFATLFRNKDNSQYEGKVKEVKKFILESMFNYWLTILTRIKYNPRGKDLVIHNYGLQDQYEIQENIVGADDSITKINPQNELNAILGSNDVNEINHVYKWITGKDAYLRRVNNKPKNIDERVARCGAGLYWAYPDCNRGPSDSGWALGVRAKLIR